MNEIRRGSQSHVFPHASWNKCSLVEASCLKHGNGEDTGSKAEQLTAHGGDGGGTSVWHDGWSSRDLGGVGRSLDLAIRNLADDVTGRGCSGSWCLDLAITNLGDRSSSGGWCLDLTVSDLGDRSTSGSSDLAVAHLHDRRAGWGLNCSAVSD